MCQKEKSLELFRLGMEMEQEPMKEILNERPCNPACEYESACLCDSPITTCVSRGDVEKIQCDWRPQRKYCGGPYMGEGLQKIRSEESYRFEIVPRLSMHRLLTYKQCRHLCSADQAFARVWRKLRQGGFMANFWFCRLSSERRRVTNGCYGGRFQGPRCHSITDFSREQILHL